MNNNTNFFSDDKGSAAVLKHGVLGRYAAKFMAKTSSTSPGRRVGFLDGYAGQGEYVNPITGSTKEGSPVILLRIAIDLVRVGRTSHLVFVEKEKGAYASLNAVVRASTYSPAVAHHGDVEEHIQAALDEFDNMPALIFLDPFGSSLDHASLVNRVLKRPGTQPTELLLNFSLQALRRMGARLWEAEGASGRAKTLERVDHWLGGDWWRAFFMAPDVLSLPKSERADAAATRVATEHAKRIHDATGCGYFAVPIRRKPHAKPLFLLTLYYPRQLAVFDFNEAVSLALKDWRAFLHDLELAEAELLDESDPQLLSRVAELQTVYKLDEAQIDRDAIDEIKKSVTEALRTRTSLSVRTDLRLVMGEAIGVGRTTHLRTAWKELAAEGIAGECPKGDLDSAVIGRAN
ncbi:three-Cys-motif partner protein TcmP [Rathayibacter sp. YIM 133350]|uniref:three-Cys-motif partner protein TcmP n=1 Tax=Rathayibacter sp. YIM 133350 TaxID=3131992 RepID=UPI00307F85A9